MKAETSKQDCRALAVVWAKPTAANTFSYRVAERKEPPGESDPGRICLCSQQKLPGFGIDRTDPLASGLSYTR